MAACKQTPKTVYVSWKLAAACTNMDVISMKYRTKTKTTSSRQKREETALRWHSITKQSITSAIKKCINIQFFSKKNHPPFEIFVESSRRYLQNVRSVAGLSFLQVYSVSLDQTLVFTHPKNS